MSKGSVNKCIIVGNLGADPEMRTTGSGSMAANMAIATSESWTDKGSGERTERTEWHRVVAWGRLAEICETYLRKGSKVYIEGRLQTRKWQDKDGADRYTTEIVASEMVMLGGRVLDEAQEPRTAPQPAAAHQAAPKARRSLKDDWEAPAAPDFDDDLPF